MVFKNPRNVQFSSKATNMSFLHIYILFLSLNIISSPIRLFWPFINTIVRSPSQHSIWSWKQNIRESWFGKYYTVQQPSIRHSAISFYSCSYNVSTPIWFVVTLGNFHKKVLVNSGQPKSFFAYQSSFSHLQWKTRSRLGPQCPWNVTYFCNFGLAVDFWRWHFHATWVFAEFVYIFFFARHLKPGRNNWGVQKKVIQTFFLRGAANVRLFFSRLCSSMIQVFICLSLQFYEYLNEVQSRAEISAPLLGLLFDQLLFWIFSTELELSFSYSKASAG